MFSVVHCAGLAEIRRVGVGGPFNPLCGRSRGCARSAVRPADHCGFRVLGVVRQGGGKAVSATNLVGLVLAVLVTAFLLIALIYPEKF